LSTLMIVLIVLGGLAVLGMGSCVVCVVVARSAVKRAGDVLLEGGLPSSCCNVPSSGCTCPAYRCDGPGAVLVSSCPTAGLTGCCKIVIPAESKLNVLIPSVEACYYKGSSPAADATQSQCAQKGGTWSTSP
jgi:hypothetical protein